MKKVYLAISYLLIANILFAQTPQGFSYQAVVRNSSGMPIANQDVSLKITLQSGSGSAYFSESKLITTNAQGVLNHIVGSGTLISGDFSTIPWSSGDVYLKVEVDPAGGTAYVQMGDPALLQSVPYALYAASGNQGAPGVDGNGISEVVDNGDGTLTFYFTDGSSYKTPNLKGEKGDKGDAGTGLNNKGNWVTGMTYNPGDYVFATNTSQTGNSMWIVQADVAFISNNEPRLDPTNWVEFQAPKGDTGDKGENGISILWLGSFPDIPHSYSLNNAYYNSTDKKAYVYDGTSWKTLAIDGSNGLPITWKGDLANAPTSPLLNWAYYNTNSKKAFIYNGSTWDILAQDGMPISGTNGQTLYYNGTAWTPTSTLYNNNTNVGIGTTSPTQILDVNGGIRLRGSIYDASNSAGSSNQLLVNNGSGAVWQSTSASGITSGTGTAGQVALWSGTNSIQGISNLSWGTTSLQIASPTSAGTDDPILEVKNKDGKVVFGVYQGGVRIYVDDSQITKGTRGGFAIGGLTNQSKEQQEYFRITPDSARIYVKEVPTTKGARGGFAIGGLTNQSKTIVNRNLMFVAPDSARFWVNETVAKGVRGGFAIGGLTNQGKGAASNFMQLTPENYFIGHQSGLNTSTGLYNSFLGYQAGMANTVGSNNSFIGYKTGLSNTLGDDNVFLGNESGYSNTEGKGNVFAGFTSGYSNTVGRNNVFIGNESGKNNTEGGNNVFIGTASGYNNIVGGNNTFLGYQTGLSNNASFNSFIGYRAGRTNSTGEKNTFMGYNAGYGNISGSSNVFIGNESGKRNIVGSNNVFLGLSAGASNDASNNVFIGYQSGISNTSGGDNVFLGTSSGYTNTTGISNVFLGFNAGYTNNANYNSFIGYQAGKANSSGSYNSFLGYNAGLSNTTGEKNVFMGYESGRTNTTGTSNVALGTNAGYNSNGSNNILIGEGAGYSLTIGEHNTFIGSSAGKYQTYTLYNVMIGTNAGQHINTTYFAGSFNVFMGINTGYQLARSRDNTLLGSNAGYWIENGAGNTFIGSDAGRGGFDRDPPWVAGTNASEENTSIGFKSSSFIQTGNYNVVLGAYAGFTNASGSGNLFLGYQAGYSETGSNKLYIANSSTSTPLIYGDFSTGSIGIGTNVLSKKFNVSGDASISGSLTVGSVNGITEGKISTGAGTIISAYNGKFILSFNGTKVTLSNTSTAYCHVWWQGQQGSTTVGGSTVLIPNTGTVDIVTFSGNQGWGYEIHFGEENGVGYCSVWIQYSNSKVFGHYILY